MAALSFDAHDRRRGAIRSRAVVSVVAAFMILTATAAVAVSAARSTRTLEIGTTSAAPGPSDAIATWVMQDAGDTLGAGDATYLGTCTDDMAPDEAGLCSALVEDLGDTQIHLVGLPASDWGADVLVERVDDGTWRVAAAAPWPDLGAEHRGPPWSPTAAIGAWWSTRAADYYGVDIPHLASCADAVAGEQALCSTVVELSETERTYDSGLVGRPADVRITLVEQPDHTWLVSDTLAR